MRNTEVTLQKRQDGAWFFKDPFDTYAPFQRVKNPDVLYAFLDLNYERTQPQTRMASFVLVQAFTDDTQAQALRALVPHLFEPQTIKDNRPICWYEDGASVPAKHGNSVEVPAHPGTRMDDRGHYWECPICGWAKSKEENAHG